MVQFKMRSLLAAAYGAVVAAAACTSDLLVDDLSNSFTTNRNNLGSWTSDDGSMASMSASGGILSFTPKAGAYYYETIPCRSLNADSYTHLVLDIKAPASGAAFTVQLTTAASCPATTGTKTSFRVTGLTGSSQTVRIPLSSFGGANLGAVVSVVIESFSSTQQWQLDKVLFACGNPTVSTIAAAPTQATSSRASTSTTVSNPGTCSPLLIDDWASQSRLDFLGYNALLLPTGDDGTMQSRVVSNNRITLTPKSSSGSYFYSQTGCIDANRFGGISLRIKAPAGTSLRIELTSKTTCDGAMTGSASQTAAQLGWTFDGTEKLYSLTWSKFSGINLSMIRSIVLSSASNPITIGPISFYCGSTPTGWVVPSASSPPGPTGTVPAPAATASALVIDSFASSGSNALGFWHGGEEMNLSWGSNRLTMVASGPDYAFTTLVSNGCRDLRGYSGAYLHIAFSGHTKFSVSLQQHNSQCNSGVAPYPETRDSLEAARYARGNDIYIPVSHFNINLQRVSSVAIRGVYTSEPLVLAKIELVPSIPSGVTIPQKLPSGTLVFACTRPNSFAFGIDDGNPRYAARLAEIIRDAGIKVTFFAVGAVLENNSTGMASLYQQLRSEGHQIALHSYTHPRMEGLQSVEAIDWEYNEDYRVMEGIFNERSNYFRPPFGVEGARMRQRWATASRAERPYIINWSVDVQDWLWAETSTPEKQVDAFNSDVAKGGNLVVMHFSYESTVNYFPEFIKQAKATGKQIMRIDQCMEDPNAPPL
ncbi:polysaccharide deacetylase [Colletotrichum sojae]|uniref:Polysaccharide deacetylase n=1 Tax=Colletotrichum sojae TaxID=2175907 RepID=A0A8H6JAJ9_9PEZI|nr:polysaccharide deacetylase [Colletotrichum sojae]